jgi:hypothetical protein
MMTCFVELCLMVYLLAHLLHLRATLPGHEAAVLASPFFGMARAGLGRLVIVSTFLAPLAVCALVLVGLFPSIQAEWSGPAWIVGWESRWGLLTAIGIADALVIVELRRITIAFKASATSSLQQGQE